MKDFNAVRRGRETHLRPSFDLNTYEGLSSKLTIAVGFDLILLILQIGSEHTGEREKLIKLAIVLNF